MITVRFVKIRRIPGKEIPGEEETKAFFEEHGQPINLLTPGWYCLANETEHYWEVRNAWQHLLIAEKDFWEIEENTRYTTASRGEKLDRIVIRRHAKDVDLGKYEARYMEDDPDKGPRIWRRIGPDMGSVFRGTLKDGFYRRDKHGKTIEVKSKEAFRVLKAESEVGRPETQDTVNPLKGLHPEVAAGTLGMGNLKTQRSKPDTEERVWTEEVREGTSKKVGMAAAYAAHPELESDLATILNTCKSIQARSKDEVIEGLTKAGMHKALQYIYSQIGNVIRRLEKE